MSYQKEQVQHQQQQQVKVSPGWTPDENISYNNSFADPTRTPEEMAKEPATGHTTQSPTKEAQFQLITAEEWEDARNNNYDRIRNSYHAGLFFPVSFLCGIMPFIPFPDDVDDNDMPKEDIHFPSSLWEQQEGGELTHYSLIDSVLNGGSDVLDYGLIGMCLLASVLTGRRAYRSWKIVQSTPPTELPTVVHLRSAAVREGTGIGEMARGTKSFR